MHTTLRVIVIVLLLAVSNVLALPAETRLIVMADMGNEPDEEQQMTHLLMYANRIDIEGLIACSGKYLNADRTDGRVNVHPELFHQLVDGYAEVVENLKQHEPGWPTAQSLRRVIKGGTPGYGIKSVKPGQSNEASKLIEAAILKNDPRKLYIVGNAGTNNLAQALVDLDQKHSQEKWIGSAPGLLCSRTAPRIIPAPGSRSTTPRSLGFAATTRLTAMADRARLLGPIPGRPTNAVPMAKMTGPRSIS